MLVVFIGLPGSGKTSMVKKLSSILGINDCFVEPEEER